jgi:RNA polymerase sigma-70 factor (ECF subfamily)
MRRTTRDGPSDEALAGAVRSGDREALGHIWDRYAHLLYGVGLKYLKDAERSRDIVVDLFADLPGLLARHAVGRFRPWLHTVMRNRCLMALRGERPRTDLHDEPAIDPEADPAADAVLREASLERLERAIEQLNADQRRCIMLFHLHRRSYRQVAAETNLTTEQVRSHLQNGRRNLRIILQRHDDRKA